MTGNTLLCLLSPNRKKKKLAVIFRGKWKRITKEEKKAWYKDVDVYFQENAWADLDFSVAWAKKTLKPEVEKEDNLTAQVSDEFKNEISSQSGVCWFGQWYGNESAKDRRILITHQQSLQESMNNNYNRKSFFLFSKYCNVHILQLPNETKMRWLRKNRNKFTGVKIENRSSCSQNIAMHIFYNYLMNFYEN